MLKLLTILFVVKVAAKFCADADGSEDGDFGENCPAMAVYPQLDIGLDTSPEYRPDFPGIRFWPSSGYTLGEFPGQYP